MYGKLENGILILAPKRLTINNKVHYHPANEMYENMGYLPVENTLQPETQEGKILESSYIEKNGRIVQVWTETEPIEEVNVPTLEDRVTTLEERVGELTEAEEEK